MVETHCPSVAQVVQLLFRQTWLALQSEPARQLPAVHVPLGRQTWPEVHWALPVQAVQALLMQTWPPLQPALVWQLPGCRRC